MRDIRPIATRAAAALLAALVAVQFVPVSRTNPPIGGEIAVAADVRAILKRSCYDCHSNETVWPWYSRVAPVSWLLAHDVNDGRRALNFSDWNGLAADRQAKRLREVGETVESGEMPRWFYLPMHPAARLTEGDKALLQAWSRSAGAAAPTER